MPRYRLVEVEGRPVDLGIDVTANAVEELLVVRVPDDMPYEQMDCLRELLVEQGLTKSIIVTKDVEFLRLEEVDGR